MKPIDWDQWSKNMYPQPPTPGYDPQPSGTQVYHMPVSHAAPNQPRRKWSPATALGLLACLLAAAALVVVTARFPHQGSPAAVSRLTSQVRTLQAQHGQDVVNYQSLSQQYVGLVRQYETLNSKVGGMTTTVNNFKPYAKAVCAIPATGSKGAYTAQVPCNPS